MATITPYLIHHTEKEKNNFKDFRLATRFYARKERGVGGRECSQRKRTKKKGGDDVTKKNDSTTNRRFLNKNSRVAYPRHEIQKN